MGPVVALGAGGGAAGFAMVVRRQWPGHAAGPAIVFAATLPLAVVAGTYPFLLALAPALFTLVAVQRGHALWATLLAALTAATHPLAFGFLVATLICIAVSTPGWWRTRAGRLQAVGLGLVTIAQAVVTLAFSSPGTRYPFDDKDALAIGAFCIVGVALTWRLADQRVLRALFAAYGVLTAGALLVTSPVGGNVVRLMLVIGAPLLMLPLAARRYRPVWLATPLVAGALFWQILPAITGLRGSDADADTSSFWKPVDAFLAEHAEPGFRVHVVATVDNWEAYYISRRGTALARGWYRQYDWPQNEILYEPLTPAQYGRWLRRMGVRYVLLPDDPLDAGGAREVTALRRLSELEVVQETAHWTFFELRSPTPIATPAAGIRLTRMAPTRVEFDVGRTGGYEVRMRYTPYWRVTRGDACIERRGDFGMTLRASRPGPVTVVFDVDLGTVARAAVGGDPRSCRG